MSRESRMSAGIILVVLPSVMYGGLSLLTFLVGRAPGTPAIRCERIYGAPGTRMPAST
jgi:hypothetical protein